MAIYSAVACTEDFGTQKESRTFDDWKASVTLRCPWLSRHPLVNDLIGNQREWPWGSGERPRVVSTSFVPFKTQFTVIGQGIVYKDAVINVSYSTKVTDLISESIEPNAEFLTLDFHGFRWGAAVGVPLNEGEAPGFLLRSLNLVRTLYHLDSIPSVVLSAVGQVNDADYFSDLLGLNFPQGTLLYTPPTMDRTITTAGSEGWNLTLKFAYKPQGWNKYWRAETQTWTNIFIAGGAQYDAYEEGDFSALLF